MIKMRHMALAATLMLTLTACGKTEDATPTAATSAPGGNHLFAYVPADSPYLVGNLEPISDEVIDTFLTRAEPALLAVQDEISLGLKALEEETGTVTDIDEAEQMAARVAHAVLQELDGKLNRQGFESLGFDLQSHKVFYGMGVFPVLRVGLSDAGTLRATIERVLDNAGIEATEQEREGIKYWRLAEEGTSSAPAGIYIAILSDHLAISLFPPMAENEMLPAFLGQSMPANSDALARLQKLNADNGYTPFGSGILDLNLMLDEFTDPNSVIAKTISSQGDVDVANLPPECVSEVRDMVNKTPRFTVGTTELSVDAVALQYRVETESSLAQELAALVAHIPLADPLSQKLMEFSFGMRLGALRDFLRNKMAAIEADPFQCEHLADLNNSAAEAFATLNQPMPPLINNFRGIRASLNRFSPGGDLVNDSRGMIAVHVEKPQMFVGAAQMFLPGMEELPLEPGADPVRLPQTMIPTPDMVAYAAISDDAIALSLGEGEQDGLLTYMARSASNDGTFLSTSYDLSSYLNMTQGLSDRMKDMRDDISQPDPETNGPEQSVLRIGEATEKVIMDIADRNHLKMRFTADGFVADTRMTFK